MSPTTTRSWRLPLLLLGAFGTLLVLVLGVGAFLFNRHKDDLYDRVNLEMQTGAAAGRLKKLTTIEGCLTEALALRPPGGNLWHIAQETWFFAGCVRGLPHRDLLCAAVPPTDTPERKAWLSRRCGLFPEKRSQCHNILSSVDVGCDTPAIELPDVAPTPVDAGAPPDRPAH